MRFVLKSILAFALFAICLWLVLIGARTFGLFSLFGSLVDNLQAAVRMPSEVRTALWLVAIVPLIFLAIGLASFSKATLPTMIHVLTQPGSDQDGTRS